MGTNHGASHRAGYGRGAAALRLVGAVAAGALIAAALACSAGGPSSAGGGAATEVMTEAPQATQAASPLDSLDPCTVLTQDDAAGFFGSAAGAGKPDHGSTDATCQYLNDQVKGQLYLLLEYDPAGALQTADYVQQKTANAQDMPGLGDGAYFDPANHMLQVAKGPWMVRLNGYMLPDGNVGPDKLTPLAKAVLGRLP